MMRYLLMMQSGRWLLRRVWTSQSKLARLISRLTFLVHRADPRLDKGGKLRGPVLWVGDLRKRNERKNS